MIKKVLVFVPLCPAAIVHVTPSTALAVVEEMMLRFLQYTVQVQRPMKAAQSTHKHTRINKPPPLPLR